jgi:DNA-directed RNA polymerase beta subunit
MMRNAYTRTPENGDKMATKKAQKGIWNNVIIAY